MHAQVRIQATAFFSPSKTGIAMAVPAAPLPLALL